MGWSTLIYLSALSAIDLELYEACEIDGGGRFSKMISVTIPGIMNVIMIQLILDIASVLSDNYDQIMAMTNQAGALVESTEVIGAIEFNAVGGSSGQARATAYGLLRGVIGLFLVLTTNKIAKSSGNEGIM
jgi:putative aldouronate transport system permease protein